MNGETAQAGAVPAPASRDRAGLLAGALPALPAIAVAVVILVVLGFDQGGYFPTTFMAAGAVAFLALGLLVLITEPARQWTIAAPALVALGSLAAYAAWAGLSSTWSTAADTPLLDMQRGMLYVALFGLALLAADSGRNTRLLIWGVLAAAFVVVGAGVLSRLQPDVLAGTKDPFTKMVGAYRLGYPLEYWNAFGGLAAIAGVLALGLAADRRARAVLRAVAAGGAVILLVALYLSLSRGAWLAFIVALVALVLLTPGRGSLLVVLAVVGAAVGLAVLRLRAYPALVTDPTAGGGQASQGDAFTPQLVGLALAATAGVGLLASDRWLPASKRRARELRTPASLAAAVLVVLVLVGGFAAVGGHRVGDFVDRQYQDFMNPTTDPTGLVGTQRVLSVKGQRSATYRVALNAFSAHPLRGEGAGSFEVRWTRTRKLDLKFRDAHSLPLETLGELGAIGMLLLLSLFGAVAVGARRCLRGRGSINRAEAAAVTAAFLAWLAHASVDWDWEMPAVTGTGLVLSAALFQRGRRRRSRVATPAAST
jgi:O-Antigen ligase